jgi:hypothetical protein
MRILNFASEPSPSSVADVRAQFRARLEAEVPTNLSRAGSRLKDARVPCSSLPHRGRHCVAARPHQHAR